MSEWQILLCVLVSIWLSVWSWTTAGLSGRSVEIKGALFGLCAAVLAFVMCCAGYVAGQSDVRRHTAVVRGPISGYGVFFGTCIYEPPAVQTCARDVRD